MMAEHNKLTLAQHWTNVGPTKTALVKRWAYDELQFANLGPARFACDPDDHTVHTRYMY